MKSAIIYSQNGKVSNDVYLAMVAKLLSAQAKRQKLAKQYFQTRLGYNDERAAKVFARES